MHQAPLSALTDGMISWARFGESLVDRPTTAAYTWVGRGKATTECARLSPEHSQNRSSRLFPGSNVRRTECYYLSVRFYCDWCAHATCTQKYVVSVHRCDDLGRSHDWFTNSSVFCPLRTCTLCLSRALLLIRHSADLDFKGHKHTPQSRTWTRT